LGYELDVESVGVSVISNAREIFAKSALRRSQEQNIIDEIGLK